MSIIKVNKIQPTSESGVLDIIGFRFLNTLLGNIVYKEDWVSGESYLANDVVLYTNSVYRCNVDHVATNTFDPTKWDLVDVTISLSGVTPGTYSKVTVDSSGRVISGGLIGDADISEVASSKLTGLISRNNLGTGTAGTPKYLSGDGSWRVPQIGKVRDTIIATAGQTVVTSSTINYVVGSGSLDVYLDGVLQILGQSYTETSSNSITFNSPLYAGVPVMLVDTRIIY